MVTVFFYLFILKFGLKHCDRMLFYMRILKQTSGLCLYLSLNACLAGFLFFSANAYAQLPSLPGEPSESSSPFSSNALPPGQNKGFSYDDSADELNFEETAEERQEQAREEAFDAALEGLLPLRPQEIRALLERFDRTQESVETPVYPNPKPEVVVQNISLDPGAAPAVVKLAYGHVTTITFLDSSGAPWPVQDISWAGNFEVVEIQKEDSDEDEDEGDESLGFTHMFRISPQSEFAYGNMSITMTALRTPVIITLETNRDIVHYRFDAVIPDFGPLAEAPLIEAGITTSAGNKNLSSILEGIVPVNAERLNVAGADGRTSAYRKDGAVYVRTPFTLLSPGWSASASSADGTRVYAIDDAPVLLLSDRGRMVRAKLSDRIDILEDIEDE